MSFWLEVFWCFFLAYSLGFVIRTVLYVFKLNIPSFVHSILVIILWVVLTILFLFSFEKFFYCFFVVDASLVFICIFIRKIMEWIEKSKE